MVIPIEPGSKTRARFNTVSKHTYTPTALLLAEGQAAMHLRTMHARYEGNVAVAAVFYRRTRYRCDVDNLLKFLLDAATKAQVWKDDSQVTALLGIMEYDAEEPRTEVVFGNHVSTMLRGRSAWRVCSSCAQQHPGHRILCAECQPKFCWNCGENLTAGACGECGLPN